MNKKPIGIFYEHPEWFKKLFIVLDERGISYKKIDAAYSSFNPADDEAEYCVIFNRISSSAYLRNHGQCIFYAKAFIAHAEQMGIPIINGSYSTAIETSKALQMLLLKKLGLLFPKTIIVNHVSQIAGAAKQLCFPLAIKPNIGGAGAGIVKYNTAAQLQDALAAESIQLGIDETALVQEFIPARGGHINRVETLNGKYLYALKIFTSGETFNLCPAEICAVPAAAQDKGEMCLTTAVARGLKVEAFTPAEEIITQVEAIVEAAGINVGGIEYIIDDRNGDVLFYDINALSNFIADAENVIGFDPFKSLADFLETYIS